MRYATPILVCALLAVVSTGVGAADIGSQARDHFNAIARGDVDAVTADYAPNAELHWVGGPLDGDYRGMGSLKQVWGKFAKAQAPLDADVENLQVNGNPAGATVSAEVTFSGANTIPVRYILLYRQGKLVDEVWQIDPNL